MRSGNNSTVGEKTAEWLHRAVSRAFGGRKVTSLVALVLGLVIIVAALIWYKSYYTNPKHVFWSMISNNLSTPGVTKGTTQSSGGSTNNEFTELSFIPGPLAHDVKDVTASASGKTSRVKVESIGTPKDTFVHYASIEQPGKSKDQFKKVYQLWLKNGGASQPDTSLFNQKVLNGATLFGNFTPKQRDTLVGYLRSAYQVNYGSVSKRKVGGRNTYVYQTRINLKNYVKALHYYAATLKLPNASQINSNTYKASDKASVSLAVGIISHQLEEVSYNGLGTTETYSSYGVHSTIQPPARTVSYAELQQAVNQAASQ
jgi:hypothetical protein